MWTTQHTMAAAALAVTILGCFATLLTRFYNLRKEAADGNADRSEEHVKLKAEFEAYVKAVDARLKGLKQTDVKHDRQITGLRNHQIAIMTKMKMQRAEGSGFLEFDDEDDES